MIPGPGQVVACPRCEAEASYSTMISGNNFGARFWTDGRMIAPMLVEIPAMAEPGRGDAEPLPPADVQARQVTSRVA